MSKVHILGDENIGAVIAAMQGVEAAYVHHSQSEFLTAMTAHASVACLVVSDVDDVVLSTLEVIASERPEAPTLVIGHHLSTRIVRLLATMSNWDTLPLSASEETLFESLTRLQRRAQPTPEPSYLSAGECYAFISTVGGAGASLLAVEAAFQARQSNQAQSVCIIDLNFIDGTVATYLNCEAGLKQASLRKDAASIDSVLLKSMATSHQYGIDIIAAPAWSQQSLQPSREFVLCLLDIACEQYDLVILDMPRWPSAWSKDVLSGCDAVMVISELTVPALNASRQWMQYVNFEAKKSALNIKLVLNRQKKSMLGSRVSIEQAEAALKSSIFATVGSDWPAAIAALNLGQAVGEMKANSAISKDVAAFMKRIRAETQAQRQENMRRAA